MNNFLSRAHTFLAQSYKDSWNNFEYCLESNKEDHWDWIVITASNKKQAETFKAQIDLRLSEKRLPKNVQYAVVPDPEGKRIGSGGSTLNVMRYIINHSDKNITFQDLKILLIHSGGDSKRIPQYSACGKLFAPIPRQLPNGKRSTLFDEIIIGFLNVASRCNNGMLVMAGDIEILLNNLQMDLKIPGAAAISVKESVFKGINHGVFLKSSDNTISHFFHKKSKEYLYDAGAVNESGNVDIDTGCIWLSSDIVGKLYSLISTDGKIDDKKSVKYINEGVRLSFYADFLFPLATQATLEDYLKETPDGEFSLELEMCRKNIWEALHNDNLRLVRLSPAKFIHFGTTREVFDLMADSIDNYSFLNWSKCTFSNFLSDTHFSCNNSFVHPSAQVDDHCYLEDSFVGENVKIGSNVVLSNVSISNVTIPQNIVLHSLKTTLGGYVVRIYGIDDNPNSPVSGTFLGITLHLFLEKCNCDSKKIWNESNHLLWNANIYPVCKTQQQAVESALRIYRIATDSMTEDDIVLWNKASKTSLKESFNQADTQFALNWQVELENKIRVEQCISALEIRNDFDFCAKFLSSDANLEIQAELLLKRAANTGYSLKMRIYLLLSVLCKKYDICLNNINAEQYENMCYDSIKQSIIEITPNPYMNATHFMQESSQISLPVRVNFCGSPSDAAPYCLEYGGTMLDAALTLKNKKPIRVEAKRLNEKVIHFESFDLAAEKTFTDLESIQNCSNPYDTFSLHKAALLASGILPIQKSQKTLQNILSDLGGGISLSTSANVPKGSGLGTSSIIMAAAIQAIHQLFGLNAENQTIYSQVFCGEQLMNTGGGWQDQVGAFTSGIKLIRTLPGICQDIHVDYVNMAPQALDELRNRFALIFSGQRRLARNVLRQEMSQCILSSAPVLANMERIQHVCVLMKYELEKGNIDSFAHYISEQFELVKKLDKGSSNTCIEYIFDVCDDLIEGKSICGAGGGGFLQVILKKGITKEQLAKRLETEFQGCGVEAFECNIL